MSGKLLRGTYLKKEMITGFIPYLRPASANNLRQTYYLFTAPFMKKQRLDATIFLRLALAAGFLSAVADRFGYWGLPGQPGVAWGNWPAFVTYTGTLTGWLVAGSGATQGMAMLATGLEFGLGLLLLIGYQTRYAAIGSGLLLLSFALSMTISAASPKSSLDYSVFVGSAAAFLLSSATRYPFSLDNRLYPSRY